MDKIKHWLKDVRGDLACSVKQMYYTNENIKIQKNISIFTFSKKHTEMFMMKNSNNGITATNCITLQVG
jgi:hypothetical protein